MNQEIKISKALKRLNILPKGTQLDSGRTRTLIDFSGNFFNPVFFLFGDRADIFNWFFFPLLLSKFNTLSGLAKLFCFNP